MPHEHLHFVTVATTWHPVRAWLIRNRLAAEGIDAIVTDEFLVTMDWLTANAVGGIKIQVPLGQAEAALDELEIDASAWLPKTITRNPEIDRCAACQSIDVCDEGYSRRAAYLGWMFFGFPIPVASRGTRCLCCGHRMHPNPRRFQFSLMSLMTWVTIAACLCGILRLAIEGNAGVNPVVGEIRRY